MKNTLKCSLLLFSWIALQPNITFSVTLEDCISAALRENPDMEIAKQRIEGAQAALRQAQSGYYPWVTAQGSFTRTDNPPQAFMMELNQRQLDMMQPDFNPNDPDHTDNIRWSLAAKYRVFDCGRREAQVNAATAGTHAAQAGEAVVRNDLVHQVTRAYFKALQACAFVEVQEASVNSLSESLRVAKERFQAGSAVKTDVLNLEVKLAEAKEDLIRAENGLKLAVATLNTTIGSELAQAGNLQSPVTDEEPLEITPCCENELNARPELLAVKAQATATEQLWRQAERDFYPVFNAFGSLDWDSGNWRGYEHSYLVGVMAEWELFTGFNRMFARRQAISEAARSKAEIAKTRLMLQFDVTQAQIALEEAQERLEVTKKNVENAREALRITRERYQQGAADITELLTAEVGLHALRTRDVAARYDWLIAQSNLERARGLLAKKYE